MKRTGQLDALVFMMTNDPPMFTVMNVPQGSVMKNEYDTPATLKHKSKLVEL